MFWMLSWVDSVIVGIKSEIHLYLSVNHSSLLEKKERGMYKELKQKKKKTLPNTQDKHCDFGLSSCLLKLTY